MSADSEGRAQRVSVRASGTQIKLSPMTKLAFVCMYKCWSLSKSNDQKVEMRARTEEEAGYVQKTLEFDETVQYFLKERWMGT